MTSDNMALVVRPPTEMVSFGEVQAQAAKLNEFYKNLMQKGTDYDVIPGTPKPTLLKPGAELLRLWTGIRVEVEVNAPREDWEKGIFAYVIKCRGYSPEGQVVGEGIGSCTSLEGKYRFRWVSDRELPTGLDKETLPKRWMKTRTGGSFPLFRIENDNAQDQANTILKMAKKRAFVDLMLTVTGASRIFTQDIEDMDLALPEIPEAPIKPTAKVAPLATGSATGKEEKSRRDTFLKLCKQHGWDSETTSGVGAIGSWVMENFGAKWLELTAEAQVDAIVLMRELLPGADEPEETEEETPEIEG